MEAASAVPPTNGDVGEALSLTVGHVRETFGVDVCSVYLLEGDRAHLRLAASEGLRKESIGRVRMRLDEGLAGLVAQELRAVAVTDAMAHPRFKLFKESGEEKFRSFCGVPLVDRGLLQGVLVVQTVEAREFVVEDTASLTRIATGIAPVISELRRVELVQAPARERLWRMARNLWWCRDQETVALFRDLDPVLWREAGQNPIALLKRLPPEQLDERASQLVLHSRINHAFRRWRDYMTSESTWGHVHAGLLAAASA